MVRGFWEKLNKPFFALAPMADVTDAAFRRIIAQYSRPEGPDVFWTEFVSADGLCLAPPEGKEKLMRDLMYSEEERPIVAQFFTSKPEIMERVSALAVQLHFDGIDINMGCPDRSIEKQGAGAALIQNPECAKELILAARRGAEHSDRKKIPVSVKTRIGFNSDELERWIGTLLEAEPVALTIHARTRKEMSKVPAHWDRIADAVALRDKQGSQTLIIGNGDITDMADARRKAKESGCDGVMLGRAIFGNPWLFQSFREKPHNSEGILNRESIKERLKVLVEHSLLFEELLPHKHFAIMKKHYKAYISGWDGAVSFRAKLMECSNAQDVREAVDAYLHSF